VKLVVLLLLAAGCKDEAISALESTRDKVCACKTAACVDTAMNALVDRPTDKQHRAESIARDITDCVARIYRQTDAAPPPPDAAPGADDAAPAPTPP
jgi:hypothetical protein